VARPGSSGHRPGSCRADFVREDAHFLAARVASSGARRGHACRPPPRASTPEALRDGLPIFPAGSGHMLWISLADVLFRPRHGRRDGPASSLVAAADALRCASLRSSATTVFASGRIPLCRQDSFLAASTGVPSASRPGLVTLAWSAALRLAQGWGLLAAPVFVNAGIDACASPRRSRVREIAHAGQLSAPCFVFCLSPALVAFSSLARRVWPLDTIVPTCCVARSPCNRLRRHRLPASASRGSAILHVPRRSVDGLVAGSAALCLSRGRRPWQS